jgi:hypothetical protein
MHRIRIFTSWLFHSRSRNSCFSQIKLFLKFLNNAEIFCSCFYSYIYVHLKIKKKKTSLKNSVAERERESERKKTREVFGFKKWIINRERNFCDDNDDDGLMKNIAKKN